MSDNTALLDAFMQKFQDSPALKRVLERQTEMMRRYLTPVYYRPGAVIDVPQRGEMAHVTEIAHWTNEQAKALGEQAGLAVEALRESALHQERVYTQTQYTLGFQFSDQWEAVPPPPGWSGFERTPPDPPRGDPNMPAPERAAVAVSDGPDARYRELCRRIGFQLPDALRVELELFLEENLIDVYPIKAVERYMDNLCRLENEKGRENTRGFGRVVWFWVPLRESDRKMVEDHRELGTDGKQGHADHRTYKHPIPMPVLETVASIAERFGERVGFFVSDYAVETPDPFLMVTAPGLPCYVIERWDEPTFRG